MTRPILDFAEAERDARRHCGVGDFQLATPDSEKATRHNLEQQAQQAVAAEREKYAPLVRVMEDIARPKRVPATYQLALRCIAAIRKNARAALATTEEG